VIAPKVDEHLTKAEAADPEKAAQTIADRKAGGALQVLLADETLRGAYVILAADTMVVLNKKIFGKPHGFSEAKGMLRALSGNTHEVITGVSVWMLVATDPNLNTPDPNAQDSRSQDSSSQTLRSQDSRTQDSRACNSDAEKSDEGHSDAQQFAPRISMGHRTFSDVSHVTFKKLSDDEIDAYLAKGESYDKAGAYAIQGEGRNLVAHLEGDMDNVIGLPLGRIQQIFPDIFGTSSRPKDTTNKGNL